jgi:NAD(P)-dependent dehydrogenase (short-subunit alcohol dehydrogenase family)
MSGRLDGKIAIVTGAGSGIGRATVRRFAAEGATVVVNDLDAESTAATVELVRAEGGRADAVPGDVTGSAFIDDLVNGTVERHGRVDVMHANAGASVGQFALSDITDAQWNADITLNLDAMFFCIRAAVRVMAAGGGGSIICTSSAAGLGAVRRTSAYGAAKAGILQLVRSAAVEYGPDNVRVNAIIPGAVRTPAFERYLGTEDRLAAYEKQIPLGRMCLPEDIAAAAVFLAADESRCVSGTSILVDGAVTALRAEPTLP